ncbi:MAG: hypothetical protein AABZ69_07430, partial [Candidatus Binatota bacterium]
FEPFSLGAFGLLGRPPHSHVESSASQRVPTTRGQSSLRDREIPWVERKGLSGLPERGYCNLCLWQMWDGPAAEAEGSASEAADVETKRFG